MKRNTATGQGEVTEFVLVMGEGVHTLAYTSPRGKQLSNQIAWTDKMECAYIYKSWQAANRAIEYNIKVGRAYFKDVKYCTFGEWLRLLNGEEI